MADNSLPVKAFSPEQLAALRELGEAPASEVAILNGIAAWLNGASLRKAAESAGCNYQTLHQRMRKAGVTDDDRESIAAQVRPLTVAIYEEAGRQTLEDLREGRDKAPKITWGIAADKLTKLMQLEKGGQEQGGGMLARLTERLEQLGGGSLELTVRHNPPPMDAITVNAVDTPEETDG